MARIKDLCSLVLSVLLLVLITTDLVASQPPGRRGGRKNKGGRNNGRGNGPPHRRPEVTPPVTYPPPTPDPWAFQQPAGGVPPAPAPAPAPLPAPGLLPPQGPPPAGQGFGVGQQGTGAHVPLHSNYMPNAFANPDCFLLMIPGNCPVDRIQYYYDAASQTCKPFWYGCNGNENRFDTYFNCMDNCAPVPEFPLPPRPTFNRMAGPGRRRRPRGQRG